jgi:hypothetical protein
MNECPLVDLTFGPLPAPEVAHNEIDGGFWLSWRTGNVSIDIHLEDREALCALIRNCLEARGESYREHEAHAIPGPRLD